MLKNATESLFTYTLDGAGKVFSEFNQPDFVPSFFSDAILSLNFSDPELTSDLFNVSQAKAICSDDVDTNVACYVDFAATGNAEVATLTRNLQQEAQSIKEKLGKIYSIIKSYFISC